MASATYGAVGSTLTGGIPGLKRSLKSSLGNYYYNDHHFGKGVRDGFLRHTWEGFQSFIGHAASQIFNVARQIDGVEYWGGATFNLASDGSGIRVSMGNYVNVEPDAYDSNLSFQENLFNDYTMMHEYGHTFESRIWGFGYLPIIGSASLYSASFSGDKMVKGENYTLSEHRGRWYERSANKYAAKYFGEYGVIWDDKNHPRRYPF